MTKNGQPGHYTAHSTRKYQCNGQVSWGATFRRAAAGAQEGDGIRAALAYAASHADTFLGWAKGHPDDWKRAATTPGKAGRAKKAPARPSKRAAAPKRAKGAPKSKRAKRAPEQLAMPEVK